MYADTVRTALAVPRFSSTTAKAVAIAAAIAAIGVVVMRREFNIGAFWLIGIAFGVIIQRSRLCFAGAFRNLVMSGDGRLMRAILVGLGLATVGFGLLMARFVPDPSLGGTLPQGAYIQPVGFATLAGGVMFGIGMVLAGGCMVGTLWRMGEGYLNSWIAMGGIFGGLWAASRTWNWWWAHDISKRRAIWLPAEIGMAQAIVLSLAVLAALVALYLLVLWWESRSPQMPEPAPKPEPPAFSVRDHLEGAWRRFFSGNGWAFLTGATALATLNVFAYALKAPLGVTGELGAWADRTAGMFGGGALPLTGSDSLGGCVVAAGASWLTDRTMLVTGIIGGAFAASVLSNEFRLRWSRQPSRYPQLLVGGLLMGYGAVLGIGCTIGAFFSSIPSLAVAGWIFGFGLLGGAFLGVQLIRRLR